MSGALIGALAGLCAVIVFRLSAAASEKRRQQQERENENAEEVRKAPVRIEYKAKGKDNEADNSEQ